MSSAWVTCSCSSSTVDIAASSSSTILSSIYGSQVSQINISESRNDYDECIDLSFDVVQKPNMRMRPRSAMATFSPRMGWVEVGLNKDNVPLPERRLSETRKARPSSSTYILLPEKKNGYDLNSRSRRVSSQDDTKRLSRPKSAFPINGIHSHQQNLPVKLKRPRTASVIKSGQSYDTQSAVRAPPIQSSTTPVVLSATPQYFDFWNEKPIKPREWSTQQFSRKKLTRPKSSSVTSGNLFRRSKQVDPCLNQDGSTINSSAIENHEFVAGNLDSSGQNGSMKLGSQFGQNGEISGQNNNENAHDDDGNKLQERSSNSCTTGNSGENRSQALYRNGSNNEGKNSGQMGQETFSEKSNENNLGEGDKNMMHDDQGENEYELDDYFGKSAIANGILNGSLSTAWLLNSGNSSTTRFELPVDMKSLENMTPMEYLKLHCKLSNQKKYHYLKTFKEVCKQVKMFPQEVAMGIFHALHEVVPVKDAEVVCEVLKLKSSDMLITNLHFGYICAVAERLYGRHYLPFEPFREIIEVVDFEALAWKLRGCNITDDLRALLFKLSS